MNCTEFESLVVGIARHERMGAAAHREGMAHAKLCARCARRLANERLLTGVAAAVAAEDQARAAPTAVEKMLLAAFRERQAQGRRERGARVTRIVAGAVAAALIVAAIVAVRRPGNPHPVQVKPSAPAAEPAKIIAPVYRELQKPRVRTLRAAQRRTARPPRIPTETREIVTDFIPVVYDPEPVEQGRVVRVRLPRAALTVFGLPVNEQHADEPIKADVLLGDDGLARAVRFVK